MDIVYLYKRTGLESDLELKFSLRSIEKNLSFDNVYIIGDFPNWVQNVIHIPFKDSFQSKAINTAEKTKHLTTIEKLSKDFVLFCDDIYVLQNIKEIKQYQTDEHIEDVLNRRKNHNAHWKALQVVYKYFPDGYNYEVHHPYIFNKKLLEKFFNKYPTHLKYCLRSLYCNEYKIKGEIVKNCKVTNIKNFVTLKNCDFVSSNKSIARNKDFENHMKKLFPNKSKFEK